MVECITTFFANLIINDTENNVDFIKLNLPEFILSILEIYNPKNNNQIIVNCILCLNQFVMNDVGIKYLAESRFQDIIFDTIERKNNDSDISKFSIILFGNYLSKDFGDNIKGLNIQRIIQILIFLQKKYYYNSDVLININVVASHVIKIVNEKYQKEKLILIINESVRIQDWNITLIQMSLVIIKEILEKNFNLIDDVFEAILLSCLNSMNNHKDSDIILNCCNILLIFSKNYIYTYVMVNNCLVELIKSTMEKIFEIEKSFEIRDLLFRIIGLLIPDHHNALKVSEELMNILIYYSNASDFIDSQE